MEKLKGSEDRSQRADPEGEEEKFEGVSLTSPEIKKDESLPKERYIGHLTVDGENAQTPS